MEFLSIVPHPDSQEVGIDRNRFPRDWLNMREYSFAAAGMFVAGFRGPGLARMMQGETFLHVTAYLLATLRRIPWSYPTRSQRFGVIGKFLVPR